MKTNRFKNQVVFLAATRICSLMLFLYSPSEIWVLRLVFQLSELYFVFSTIPMDGTKCAESAQLPKKSISG